MATHRFGGKWTVEKLSILSDYLNFYVEALKNKHFKLMYIDAFAGNGRITTSDGERRIEGSARLALRTVLPFDEYIFIEKNSDYARELEAMVKNEFPQLVSRTKIISGDCNEKLTNITKAVNWRARRAVLFLDPYAASVKYETLQAVAATKSIDVWYLFPMMAAQRLMPNNVCVYDSFASWKKKLDGLFGSSDWYDRFYRDSGQMTLFGSEDIQKVANEETLKAYITERLKAVFPNVAANPRMLYNTNNAPLFLFCFAVSNPDNKAFGLALKVADHILKKDWADKDGGTI